MGYFIKNRQVGRSPNGVSMPLGANLSYPNVPNLGNMRYNEDITTMEFWDGTSWIPLVIPGTVTIEIDKHLGDDIETVFALTQESGGDNQILVFVGGVFQESGVSYTTLGLEITFLVAPPTDAVITVVHNVGKVA